MIPSVIEQHGYRVHVSASQGGNMGAPVTVYRAFCSCHWTSRRTSNEWQMTQWVSNHLADHAPDR